MSKKAYKSDAFEAVYTSAQALLRTGVIDKATMRNFDSACLTVPPSYAPQDIQKLRETNKVSQPVFARYLNTSESTIEKWETGAKRPSGMALKLLSLVEKHGLEVLA
jgi:putative transcriptional regulator